MEEEDLPNVNRAKHAAFYLHQHLLAKPDTDTGTSATGMASSSQCKPSKCVQTDPVEIGDGGVIASDKPAEEGGPPNPKKWLSLFQETPPFSALSDLVNHLSTRNIDKYCFKYRRNRDGAIEQLEVALENAVITVSAFSDVPTRLLFSKKGKLTILTLFRDPFQTEYIDLVSGEVFDNVVENAFLTLDNEQLFCPGVPKDIASKPSIGKKVQKFRFPFERFQSRGCPVWFDPPQDEIFAQDILIRKGIHPCEKCFKLYSLASNDVESDDGANAPGEEEPTATTSTKDESPSKRKTGAKRKYVKKKGAAEPSPTMVPRAANIPGGSQEGDSLEGGEEGADSGDEDFDLGGGGAEESGDSDQGSDYAPSPEPQTRNKRKKSEEKATPKAKKTPKKSSSEDEATSGEDSGKEGGGGGGGESNSSSESESEKEAAAAAAAPKKAKQTRGRKKKEPKEKFRLREVFRCEDCDKNFAQEKPWKTHRMSEHADEKPYKCDLNCPFTTPDKTELIDHYAAAHANDQVLKCRFCYRQYIKAGELNAHTRHHKGEKPVKCQQCPKILSNERALILHTKYRHKNNGEDDEKSGAGSPKSNVCDICGKRFALPRHLVIHKRTHTDEKPYQCETCGKDFRTQSNLINHNVTHTGVKKYLCTLCGKCFPRANALKGHMEAHAGIKPHKCQVCGKSFRTPDKVRQHMVTHTGETPFQCELCGKGFKRNDGLAKHMFVHSPQFGDKPFQCELCHRTFKQSESLARHELSHSAKGSAAQKPFQCERCGKSYINKMTLTLHIRTHTGEKLFHCDQCQRSFTNGTHLRIHARSHTGEKPFQCEICSRSFPLKTNLARHKLTHTGEKPYQCEICEKRFAQKPHLETHLRTHTGERPFQCPVCQKAFAMKGNLNDHVRSVHDGQKTRRKSKSARVVAPPKVVVAQEQPSAEAKTFVAENSDVIYYNFGYAHPSVATPNTNYATRF